MRVVEKAPDEFGRHRHGEARLGSDGYWHLSFDDEKDLTFIVSKSDMSKRYWEEGEYAGREKLREQGQEVD